MYGRTEDFRRIDTHLELLLKVFQLDNGHSIRVLDRESTPERFRRYEVPVHQIEPVIEKKTEGIFCVIEQ